jgi:hypothetical protein
MAVKRVNITVFRGDNSPGITWTMPFDPTGYSFTLTIKWDWDSIVETVSGGGLSVNNSTHVVTWNDSVADTTKIPEGNYATYELRSELAGVYVTRFYGEVRGLGGRTVD